jgi:predicted ATPase/DNA-binding CsgD family transcriptional regulator
VEVVATDVQQTCDVEKASGSCKVRSMPAVVANSNLPADLTKFLGRRRELTEAKQHFAATRFLTLAGPGGVGKTRLALRLAAELRTSFRDGVWLVELAELQDPNLLAHTVGASLGLGEQSANWGVAALIAHVADKRMLLVLDNCEHLVDASADLVDALLKNCPQLRVLVTSRQTLRINGESVVSVQPLSVPTPGQLVTADGLKQYDAVALFLDRASRVDPNFKLTDENHELLVRLCHTLEGIPLALELAAGRLGSLSLTEISDRMDDPYRLLTRGSRNSPQRQQTLLASIDWTFGLCSGEEKLLWSRLSTFAGSFEMDAAEAICSGEGLSSDSILDLVTSLVDKSILVKREPLIARYYMLETIRQYGEARLKESGDFHGLRRRHRDWYAALVESVHEAWFGPRQAELIGRLRREHANLRRALDFCVSEAGEASVGLGLVCALEPYWLIRGAMSEGRLWLDRLLPQEAKWTVARALSLRLGAFLASLQGDYGVAEEQLDQAHRSAVKSKDPVALAYVGQTQGALAMFRGDPASALVLFEQALPAFRAGGDRMGEALTLFQAGMAAGLSGDDESAVAWHQSCLGLTEPFREGWFRSWSLWAMGMDAWRRGDNHQAAGLERESLRIKRNLDDHMGIATCLEALAWVSATDGEGDRAGVLLGAAEAIWRRIGMSLAPMPGLWAYREKAEARAREDLDDRAFQDALAHGLGLTVDQASRYALEEEVDEPQPRESNMEAAVLTPREREVCELVADGLSNRQIAERLVISKRTAEAHVEHILIKLGFTSRVQVAAWLAERRAERRLSDS